MDLGEFTERLFSIERRLELFSDRSAGIPWWDSVRYEVYEYLFSALTASPGVPAARSAWSVRVVAWLKRTSLRIMLYLKIRLFRYDVIVLRAPRQRENGRLLDPGIDDFVALCPGRLLTINTFPYYYHLGRRGSAPREFTIGAPLDRLIGALTCEFGNSWDSAALRRLIAGRLAAFDEALAVYRRLFGRVKPLFVIMTQNGMEKALFLAAHEMGIPVIEGQHGLIGGLHPAYSYPRDVDYGDRSTFPSLFLAFSDYWIRSCFYPAGRCISLGNDHFMVKVLPPADSKAVMFISGEIYHDALRDWVIGLAAAIPDSQVIYKLHPNQHHASRKIQKEFSAFTNIQVIDASVSARSLLSRVAHVVLIQSTVALEALQTGRSLCILPILHYRVHADLFQFEAVTVTPSLSDLVAALERAPTITNPPTFFAPFDAAAAAELLRDLFATTVVTGR